MRKVIVSEWMSLDGVVQAPGGPEEDPTGGFKYGGWTAPYFDDVLGQAIGELHSKPFQLLLGRKTYEIFAAHWPYAEAGEFDHIAKSFNKTRKYVATRSSAPLTWHNSVAIHDPAATPGTFAGGCAATSYNPLASTMSKTPRRSLPSFFRSMARDGLRPAQGSFAMKGSPLK